MSSNRLQTLADTILKSPNTTARKEALIEIRKYDHPRVLDLLQQVSKKDRDREVRDLAGHLFTKKQLQQPADEMESIASNTSVGGFSARSSAAGAWKCGFCGAENTSEDRCSSCGAARQSANTGKTFEQPDNLFLLNPANRAFLEGEASHLGKRTGVLGTGCIVAFLIPFVLVGIMVIAWGVVELRQWSALSTAGLTTEGEYTSRRISSGDDSDHYYVTYAYELDGSSYTREQNVSQTIYNQAETGAPVQVMYYAYDPGITVVEGTNHPPLFQFGFGFCWNGLIWSIILGVTISAMRDRKLAKEGQLVRGEIVTAKSSIEGEDNDYHLKLEYAFREPSTDKLIVHTAKQERNDLKDQALPAPGTPLAVLYRNAKHHKPL